MRAVAFAILVSIVGTFLAGCAASRPSSDAGVKVARLEVPTLLTVPKEVKDEIAALIDAKQTEYAHITFEDVAETASFVGGAARSACLLRMT